MKPEPHNPRSINPNSASDDAARDSRLSALVDGELSPGELAGLLSKDAQGSDLYVEWNAYQLITEVLRDPGFVIGQQPPQSFLTAVRSKLQAELEMEEATAGRNHQKLPLRDDRVVHLEPQQVPVAANDGVFRWKLVAGLASLAAVLAVSWTVLDATRVTPSSGGSGGQLALASPAPVPALRLNGSPDSRSLMVSTDRGTVIRDAQLEALMAEHRHGGVSALQMPAGFLRNATYEQAGR